MSESVDLLIHASNLETELEDLGYVPQGINLKEIRDGRISVGDIRTLVADENSQALTILNSMLRSIIYERGTLDMKIMNFSELGMDTSSFSGDKRKLDIFLKNCAGLLMVKMVKVAEGLGMVERNEYDQILKKIAVAKESGDKTFTWPHSYIEEVEFLLMMERVRENLPVSEA